MRSAPIFTCLWPGLARLWVRGETFGVVVALLFAIALNTALVASFVWTDWLPPTTLRILWSGLLLGWGATAWRTYRNLSDIAAGESEVAGEDLFQQAQTEYLRGHWVEAESILERIARHFPNDVDARLMLATLQRHTGRLEEARSQLKLVSRLTGSQKWSLEIAREDARISEIQDAKDEEESSEETDQTEERNPDSNLQTPTSRAA